jgi:hypothetical protein
VVLPGYAVVRVPDNPGEIIDDVCPLQHPAGARCAGIEKNVEVGCREVGCSCGLPQPGVGSAIRGLGPSDNQPGLEAEVVRRARFAEIPAQRSEVDSFDTLPEGGVISRIASEIGKAYRIAAVVDIVSLAATTTRVPRSVAVVLFHTVARLVTSSSR